MAIKKLTPNLMVEDVNATVEFYRDVLGFDLLVTVPDSGTFDWAMMKCGEAEIMFQARGSLIEELPAFEGAEIGGSLTLYFEVEDVESFHERIKDKVSVIQEMETKFYGMREFYIRDCNGYTLALSQRMEPA